MPQQGKYSAADVQGKYTAADVMDTPSAPAPAPEDKDALTRAMEGFGGRMKGIANLMRPSTFDPNAPIDERIADAIPMAGTAYKMVKGFGTGLYDNAKRAGEEAGRGEYIPAAFHAASAAVGGAGSSQWDKAMQGDTAGALGEAAFDLPLLTADKWAPPVARAATGRGMARAVEGVGRAVDTLGDLDITRPAKIPAKIINSAGGGVRRAAQAKLAAPELADQMVAPGQVGHGPSTFEPAPIGMNETELPPQPPELVSPLERGTGPSTFQPAPVGVAGANVAPPEGPQVVGPLEQGGGQFGQIFEPAPVGIAPPPEPPPIRPPRKPLWQQMMEEESGQGPVTKLGQGPGAQLAPDAQLEMQPGPMSGPEIPPEDLSIAQENFGRPDMMDDQALLQSMRQDLERHGQQATHQLDWDDPAVRAEWYQRNKIGRTKSNMNMNVVPGGGGQ